LASPLAPLIALLLGFARRPSKHLRMNRLAFAGLFFYDYRTMPISGTQGMPGAFMTRSVRDL
jgi:hypothetical protein